MKLVATFNVGRVWYADYTVPFMRRYAQKIGADFIEFTTTPNRSLYGDWAGWLHIEAIRFLASQCWYDSMLLLDADQLVLPRCPDVFERANGQIAVVQDMGIPTVEEKYRNWSLRYYGDSPPDGPYFNSGMFVIPANAARRLLPLINGPYPSEWFSDQHYVNRLFVGREGITWLPCEFNWLAPQYFEGSLEKNIVHFVGNYKNLIPKFVNHPELRASLAISSQ